MSLVRVSVKLPVLSVAPIRVSDAALSLTLIVMAERGTSAATAETVPSVGSLLSPLGVIMSDGVTLLENLLNSKPICELERPVLILE